MTIAAAGSQGQATVQELPDEILIKVFEYLDPSTIMSRARRVCTHWQALSHDDPFEIESNGSI